MKSNRLIKIRKRFFIAGEGQSEQSFMKWLQVLTDEKYLSCHLDYKSLDGGGYESMINKAIKLRQRGLTKGAYKGSFLIVDADRSERGDWSLKQLRSEAAQHQIQVCVQKPNHEGLLLHTLCGEARLNLTAGEAKKRLERMWPEYEKGLDARTLSQKLSFEKLLLIAKEDEDLKVLLTAIGLISP